ncbi:CHAP domain-containing protein [Cryobacterium sp. SO2]|uniref:CHAP domain-containing protein n=1 Tax=Cryobacterium sp. SO2 TaxID=1897060 RepID=UPI00223DB402|nr:CHAP domain-containing protein [Cryobacterium sp. SO2]WEO76584.1 CHAP domain-containing protein [Cryobacterium sp. SO2]
MTQSGPAGSPEGDGALPTRREARARREAAAALAAGTPLSAPAAAAPPADAAVPAEVVVLAPAEPAVPVPPVPVQSVSPDLAVVVESATTLPAVTAVPTPVDDQILVERAPLTRPESAPPGSTVPGLAAPQPLASEPTVHGIPVPPRGVRLRPVRFTRQSASSATQAPAGSRPAAATRPTQRRKPIAKMVTLLAIPAIFLTAALPAYAFSPQGGSTGISSQASGETQDLTVTAAAAAASISTDGFTATSQAELDDIEAGLQADLAQQQAAEEARSAAAEFAVYGIRAEGDDYPWPTAGTESQGGGLSPLGYYYRECVDFVAWRLNRDAGSTGSPWKWTWSTMTPGGGNASAWASNWAAKGWPSSKSPVVGAVAWFTYNHVAYVQSVPGDGTVVLEEYNWMGSHAYHTRTVPISEVPVYLYPPT